MEEKDEEKLVEKEVERVCAINTRVALYDRKIGRNDQCPCGSGKKYKTCCESKDKELIHGKRFKVKRLVKEKLNILRGE